MSNPLDDFMQGLLSMEPTHPAIVHDGAHGFKRCSSDSAIARGDGFMGAVSKTAARRSSNCRWQTGSEESRLSSPPSRNRASNATGFQPTQASRAQISCPHQPARGL